MQGTWAILQCLPIIPANTPVLILIPPIGYIAPVLPTETKPVFHFLQDKKRLAKNEYILLQNVLFTHKNIQENIMISFFMMSFMSAYAAPQEYTLNPKGSNLYVTVYKNEKTLLSAAAHNHAIRAKNITSSLQWDPENIAACKINISFNVSDLEVDSAQSRSLAASKEKDKKVREGFEKTISDCKEVFSKSGPQK